MPLRRNPNRRGGSLPRGDWGWNEPPGGFGESSCEPQCGKGMGEDGLGGDVKGLVYRYHI